MRMSFRCKVAALLSIGASVLLPAAAFAQADPKDFVCYDTSKCKSIKLKEWLPQSPSDNEIYHLYKGAKFIIVPDGQYYSMKFRSGNWLGDFTGANPLTWVEGNEWMDPDLCDPNDESKLRPFKTMRVRAQAKRTGSAETKLTATHAHFRSQLIPLHLDEGNYTTLDYHTLLIYPLKPAGGSDRYYCLMFVPLIEDGKSHGGAVHGDPD